MFEEVFDDPIRAGAYLVLDKGAYLLGGRTVLDHEPPMLDWRAAPLAEAFFRPGTTYSIELADRVLEGRVETRVLRGGGQPDSEPRPTPAPANAPDRETVIVLDPEQQAAVDLPSDTSLVVDGEAGVGKTLVALYRARELVRRTPKLRALVLVPTEGLRRLVRLISDRLGIGKLEVAVFDDWLLERARDAFPGLPKRTSEGASAQVIALKRHPAVRAVLDDFIGWKPPRGVDDDNVSRTRQRLLHLWGDQARMERVVAASDRPVRAIAQVMQHTRRQFETSTERQMRHVDADRLVALDGRRLDSGTPMQDANTFDLEDVPVLFELVRRGALPGAKLPLYDHIVVDEAQLRAPMELAAVADALADRGTVTIAGDHRQATDESAHFTGWAAARAELRRGRWAEFTLAVTYRSVPAIAAFARDRRLPAELGAVWHTRTDGALAQAAQLCWHLDALVARDPWRQICVIARNPDHARRLHADLARGLDPTLVLDGDFRFEPGVIVTTAAAISGLEFDAVVIPDLAPGFYPDAPEIARAFYVAATRARDWLWLLTPDAWSPLVVSS
jgi:DNA helicase II / ATP-dependent DNA helicase PcrA